MAKLGYAQAMLFGN